MNELHLEQLISRAIDGEITDREWQELEAHADQQPTVWRQIAREQRDHAALVCSMEYATAVADCVDLPRIGGIERTRSVAPVQQLRLNRLGAWTGWAVAAVVTLVASAQWIQPAQPNSIPTPVHSAGIVNLSAAEAFQTYLDEGRKTGEVVGEVPGRLLIETKPALSGQGYEVIYVRQVMERTIVPDLYQIAGPDEIGRPTLVRYQPTPSNSM